MEKTLAGREGWGGGRRGRLADDPASALRKQNRESRRLLSSFPPLKQSRIPARERGHTEWAGLPTSISIL